MNTLLYSSALSTLIIASAIVYSYFDQILKKLHELKGRFAGFPDATREKSVIVILSSDTSFKTSHSSISFGRRLRIQKHLLALTRFPK